MLRILQRNLTTKKNKLYFPGEHGIHTCSSMLPDYHHKRNKQVLIVRIIGASERGEFLSRMWCLKLIKITRIPSCAKPTRFSESTFNLISATENRNRVVPHGAVALPKNIIIKLS